MRISDWSSDVCSSDLSQAYKIRRRSTWSLGIMLEEATVIVADDHPMFRVALRLGVERIDPAVRVIEVDSLTALKDAVRRHPETKLVLLDLMLPDVEGLAPRSEERRDGEEWAGKCSSLWWTEV